MDVEERPNQETMDMEYGLNNSHKYTIYFEQDKLIVKQ